MPQLDPTWFISQLFWLAVAFVTLYALLSRWALPRLMGVMDERKQAMEGDLDRAERLTQEASRAREEYEHALNEARLNAQQALAETAAVYKTKAEQSHKAMDAQIADMLEEAGHKIESQKKELVAQLTPASTELANMIVEKLTKEPLGQEKLQSIVSDVLKAYSR